MGANRTAGRDAKFTVPLVDDAGEAITASAVSWKLFDARGTEIATDTVDDFVAGSQSADFTIPAEHLALPVGVPSAGREVIVYAQAEANEAEIRDYFVLVDPAPLKLMVNTAITYPEALALRQGFGPVLDGWDATPDAATRSAALTQAFNHLCRIQYSVPRAEGTRDSDYAGYGTGTDMTWEIRRRVSLQRLSLEEFDALSSEFQEAVRRAQLVEADVLLGGDIVGRKRRDGIISETVGESSTFFNSKPYLNLPISKQAFEEISRFVSIKIGIARG